MGQIGVLACVAVVTVTALPIPGSGWNIPGHMLLVAITYQVLQQENPQTVDKVKAMILMGYRLGEWLIKLTRK